MEFLLFVSIGLIVGVDLMFFEETFQFLVDQRISFRTDRRQNRAERNLIHQSKRFGVVVVRALENVKVRDGTAERRNGRERIELFALSDGQVRVVSVALVDATLGKKLFQSVEKFFHRLFGRRFHLDERDLILFECVDAIEFHFEGSLLGQSHAEREEDFLRVAFAVRHVEKGPKQIDVRWPTVERRIVLLANRFDQWPRLAARHHHQSRPMANRSDSKVDDQLQGEVIRRMHRSSVLFNGKTLFAEHRQMFDRIAKIVKRMEKIAIEPTVHLRVRSDFRADVRRRIEGETGILQTNNVDRRRTATVLPRRANTFLSKDRELVLRAV